MPLLRLIADDRLPLTFLLYPIFPENASGTKSDQKHTAKLYRVQVGAYSTRNSAQKVVEKLKKAGFDGTIL